MLPLRLAVGFCVNGRDWTRPGESSAGSIKTIRTKPIALASLASLIRSTRLLVPEAPGLAERGLAFSNAVKPV